MANPESVDAPRRKGRRKGDDIGSEDGPDKWRGDIEDARKPSLEELRNLRNQHYSGGSTKHRTAHRSRMATALSRSSLSHSKSSSRHRSRSAHPHRLEAEIKPHRRRRKSSRDEEPAPTYVYGPPKAKVRSATLKVTEKRASRQVDSSSESSTSDGVLSVVSEESEHEHRSRKAKVVYVRSERPRSSRRKGGADDGKTEKENAKMSSKSSRRSYISTSRPSSSLQPLQLLKRTLSMQDSRVPRSTPKRSHSITTSPLPTKTRYEPSMTSTKHTKKSSGFLGLWQSQTERERKPVRLVECLTCLSDDIPRNKAAKLQCEHYMCHSCLKRIFELSVKDPQHMPPKCCTSDHIPLKHVDRLFNNDFKKLWNRKHIEYTTKNRMYCPGKRCGEWINPKKHVHIDGGIKYAKCGSCNTKICFLCNGKWHGKKDCPKDEETNALLETAKKAGWQRCYSCRTLVELKEGCNHMTCRCKAEFCMICGVKWKTCNCPWFNYEQVENDRLEHMRVPGDIFGGPFDNMRIPERPRPGQRPERPRAYHGEPGGRNQLEAVNERLLWEFENLGIGLDDGFDVFAQYGNRNRRYRGPVPFGADQIREARVRGMPPPPPPLPPPIVLPSPALRRPILNQRPPAGRASETLVPRRPRTDYAAEAASHAPLRASATQRRPSSSRRTSGPIMPPRRSELAGLVGRGRDRVGNWRAHVEPGVTPEEGVLSI